MSRCKRWWKSLPSRVLPRSEIRKSLDVLAADLKGVRLIPAGLFHREEMRE